MQHPETLLLAAVRAAPRRFRMPPLPADADAAASIGVDAALAFALEAARAVQEHGSTMPARVEDFFAHALAGLIRRAVASEGGDPAFQALVLQAQSVEVREHVRLTAQLASDRRAVRAITDAIGHPGKLRDMPAGATRDALARLRRLAAEDAWTELAAAIGQPLAQDINTTAGQQVPSLLEGLRSSPALQRLAHGSALLRNEAVQHYLRLSERRGPLAGTDAAAASGRASARLGEQAEHATGQALGAIAELLNRHREPGAAYRVVRSLRPPRGFPGETNKAKDEWDAAIVRSGQDGGADEIVLLAEIKASPAAATSDFPRLLRGLRRLAHADPGQTYAFASATGQAQVAGTSLRRLQPHGHSLPPHVIYCCSAPAESHPPFLSAATKAVLLGEPASLASACRLARGEAPPDSDLLAVWHALPKEPRLRSALYQYETAKRVREAMVHPLDLLSAMGDGPA
ncbi:MULTISPECIES: hypothetical protein [unclassified Variovorax]|uniref:hypothetical protein n=1 Tax=unclassified Variovorax TaxID=663243 RepID=UPI00076C3FCB|nr:MULTISPECIES: hypothetical protein [unclassified Variovorax]KWT94211.1 hypothetical protein APY03_2807 [Variovorax sp. WDL1]